MMQYKYCKHAMKGRRWLLQFYIICKTFTYQFLMTCTTYDVVNVKFATSVE